MTFPPSEVINVRKLSVSDVYVHIWKISDSEVGAEHHLGTCSEKVECMDKIGSFTCYARNKMIKLQPRKLNLVLKLIKARKTGCSDCVSAVCESRTSIIAIH